MLAEIEVAKLLEVIWVSLVAGVGISTIFSVVVYAGSRAGEARHDRRGGEATFFVAVAVVSFLVFVVGVVIGVGIMLNKG